MPGVPDGLPAVLPPSQVVAIEQRCGVHSRVVVEFIQQHDVGADLLQDRGDFLQALVLAGFEGGGHLAVPGEAHGDIEGGDTNIGAQVSGRNEEYEKKYI